MGLNKTIFVTGLAICALLSQGVGSVAAAQDSACEYYKVNSKNAAAKGAGMGAVVGAAARNTWEGTVLGGVIGAVFGAIAGSAEDKRACEAMNGGTSSSEAMQADLEKLSASLKQCLSSGSSCVLQDNRGTLQVMTVQYDSCTCYYLVETSSAQRIVPVCGTVSRGRFAFNKRETDSRLRVTILDIQKDIRELQARQREQALAANLARTGSYLARAEANLERARGGYSGGGSSSESNTSYRSRTETESMTLGEERALARTDHKFEVLHGQLNTATNRCHYPSDVYRGHRNSYMSQDCRFFNSDYSVTEAKQACEAHVKANASAGSCQLVSTAPAAPSPAGPAPAAATK